jgi:disulfide bond formation protein DsbB
MIGMALYFEHVMGLHPCQLCHWQRIPHIIVIGLSVIAALQQRQLWQRSITALMCLTLMIGAGIAFWHSGVELKILPGLSSCSAPISLDGDPAALLDQVLSAPTVRCDEVPWSLFGLSMANWNGLITAGMALAAGVCFFKTVSRESDNMNKG